MEKKRNTTPQGPQKAGKIPQGQQVKIRNKNASKTKEFNGPKGPEPTRYGDWERKGRVSDF